MLVTPSGILMLFKLWQFQKAPPPMLVTPLGILMLFKLLHPLKASSPMLVTPSGITTFVHFSTFPIQP